MGVAQATTLARLPNGSDAWTATTCGFGAPSNMMRNTAKCSSNRAGTTPRTRTSVASLAIRRRSDFFRMGNIETPKA